MAIQEGVRQVDHTPDLHKEVIEASLGGLDISITLPQTVIPNSYYIQQRITTNSGTPLREEDIEAKLGIKSRRIADSDASVQSMGEEASTSLIAEYGNEIKKVRFLTSHPSRTGRIPGHNHAESLVIRSGLGIDISDNERTRNALDLHLACSTGAAVLNTLNRTDGERNLITASEIYSRTLPNPVLGETDPSMSFLIFSDGAGAMSYRSGVDLTVLASEDTHLTDCSDLIRMVIDPEEMEEPYEAIHIPRPELGVEGRPGKFTMDGKGVLRRANAFADGATALITRSKIDYKDIKKIIPHQASRAVLEVIRRRLPQEPQEKFVIDMAEGNFSSASIMKALAKQINQGEIQHNDKVVLMGFGAGMYSSTHIVQFGEAA